MILQNNRNWLLSLTQTHFHTNMIPFFSCHFPSQPVLNDLLPFKSHLGYCFPKKTTQSLGMLPSGNLSSSSSSNIHKTCTDFCSFSMNSYTATLQEPFTKHVLRKQTFYVKARWGQIVWTKQTGEQSLKASAVEWQRWMKDNQGRDYNLKRHRTEGLCQCTAARSPRLLRNAWLFSWKWWWPINMHHFASGAPPLYLREQEVHDKLSWSG